MSSSFRRTDGLLALALLVGFAGCSASRIWDVAASPDGGRVEVVGAEVNEFSAPIATKPLRWVCIRGTDDRLTCQMDASNLPQAD